MEENKITSKDIIDVIPLDNSTNKLAQDIINEDNLDQVKNLTHLFNLNQAKKNVLRILKLNQLLDKVSDQMIERFEKRPGEFSNSDLLNYMQITQSAIDRANKSLNLVDETPAIQINQQNVIVEKDVLDRESRDKITDAVNAILKKLNNKQENEDNPVSLIENNKDEIIIEENKPIEEQIQNNLLNEEE